MTASPNQPEPRRRTDRPRVTAVWNALQWLVLIVLALVPFPWWL